MSDGTQAVGKMDFNVDDFEIDVMPFSAHKMYGPKGVGGLYIRQRKPRRVKLEALQHGGGHEKGLRSGTLNVPGIIGLGKASEIAKNEMHAEIKRIKRLKDKLEVELLKIENSFLNGKKDGRIHNTINICFPGVDSDALIMSLSNPNNAEAPIVALSNGSACTAHSIEPSHVLTAMGLSEAEAFSSIRISLGRFTTEDEVMSFIDLLNIAVKRLKTMGKGISIT